MTFALSHTLSRPASSAHFSAPVKFGIRPRAPGNRATPRSCISDQTSSLISSLDIHRRQQETSVRNFVPEIPPASAGGSFQFQPMPTIHTTWATSHLIHSPLSPFYVQPYRGGASYHRLQVAFRFRNSAIKTGLVVAKTSQTPHKSNRLLELAAYSPLNTQRPLPACRAYRRNRQKKSTSSPMYSRSS